MTRTERCMMFSLAAVGVVLLCASVAAADTDYTITVKWRTTFKDTNYGEDADKLPVGATYGDIRARHAIYSLTCDGQLLSSGALNGRGVMPTVTIPHCARCVIKLWTVIVGPGDRWIYVGYDPSGGLQYSWFERVFYACSGQPTANVTIAFANISASANVAAVAGRFMARYITLRTPDNWTLPVYVSPACGTTAYRPASDSVCIKTNYFDSDTGAYYDHSEYKFIVSHELGHFQAFHRDGPIVGRPTLESDRTLCNCQHNGSSYCRQSQEYIGQSALEAWATFYGLTLYNDRVANSCGMGYWRRMYAGPGPSLDYDPPPVRVYCAENQRWLYNYCELTSDTGTISDWINFFFNVWTQGGSSARFGVSQLNDIWASTDHASVSVGERWEDLVATVESTEYPRAKKDHFIWTGQAAGVDY
jgi:hypothetical protein